MMNNKTLTIVEFISWLHKHNIKVSTNGKKLFYDAPKGAVTPTIRQNIAERKAEIMRFLQQVGQVSSPTIPPIKAIPRDQKLPLSFSQEQLWFIDQLEGSKAPYIKHGALRMTGNLNVLALKRSLSEIVRRHEVLRTSFPTVNGTPTQVINPHSTININVVDLQEHPEQERKTVLQQQIQQEGTTPFDLEVAPLIRFKLWQLDTTEYVLVLTIHHIVSDHWSMGILIQELSRLYPAFCAGTPSPLPELPIQYADFALWQRQWLTGEILNTQLNYWKQELEGAPELLQLPTDRPRPHVQSYRGSSESFSVTTELTQKLQQLSRNSGSTLFMILQAALATLLYRYSGQSDILIGTPIANRKHRETESLIGFFLNTLVLRTRFEDNPSFSQLLRQVRETTLIAYEHQDVPFEQVVSALQPQRSLSHSPLFQVMFVLQNVPMGTLDLPGVSLSELNQQSTIAKFDLSLSITETDMGLIGEWEYNTDLFDESTIARMTTHFNNLLSAIVNNPQQVVSELSLLSERERHQLLVEWNDTTREYPTDKCIHQLVEKQVEKTPDAIAVVFEKEQLTYYQLNQRANQLAHHLQNLGVGPEVLVGICVERSVEMVVGLLGILKAGGAYVPLDPNYPHQRLSYMLEDSGVEVLLTQQSLLESLPSHTAQMVCLDSDWGAIKQHSGENLDVGVTSDNLAYVIYTSGSTGQPKGVAIEHHSPVALCHWAKQTFTTSQLSGVLAATSICFDLSVFELFVTLSVGGQVILAQNALDITNLDTVAPITLINTVPSAIAELLRVEGIPPQVQTVNLAGEPIQNQIVQQLYEHQTIEFVYNLYGPSEDTTYSTKAKLVKGATEAPSIGRPIANTQVYLLDSHLQPVPIGVPGELYIGGDGLAREYLNRPELTSEKFIHNPFCNSKSQRLYKTGDLARYRPDGNIEFLGRIDNQVKIRGFRIELGEIEAVLSSHPQIEQAVVIATEELPSNKRLVAYYVSENESLSTNQVREFLKQKLPDYMVPSALVILETLPLTPNGKVDRKSLPAPDGVFTSVEEYVAPRTPTEEIIANIFANVLGVPNVGIHDNFFEIGGHSLLATQLISQLRVTFNREIPLRQVFESPTIALIEPKLSQLLTTDNQLSLPPIQPRTDSEQLPLSSAQERLWFLNQLEGSSATYNIPAALRITGNLVINALDKALSEIVSRHEVLRTSFRTVNGTPTQVIHPDSTININVVDLQQHPEAERETVLQQQVQEEATTPFDLEVAPLIRCKLWQLDTSECVLALTMHHIVSDGWSMGILIQELSRLYQAFAAEEPSPLPELAIQYADFTLWQRQWLTGEVLETQLNYWKEALEGAPELLQLPTDRSRPHVQSYRGSTEGFSLTTELTQKLQQLSRNLGSTLFMTLQAALATLLYRYSGQNDILIGSPIANRNRHEIESLIGFFVNTLVLRTRFEDNPSFSELLRQVRENTLIAYEHQDVPFEQVVSALQPQRSLSHSPLFQVMFVLQNAPMGTLDLPGVSLSELNQQSTIAKFDLTLSMTETDMGLVGTWEYNTDLFDRSTIKRMATHFNNLLSAIVENPQQVVGELPLLSAQERHQLLVEWNDTASAYPTDKCIHQLVEKQVEKTPDAIAVVFEKEQLTYCQLNQRANQLAHHLQNLGVGPEVLVGICVERSVQMVVGLLGILKAGGAYVPLDPNYPPERLSYMLADAGVEVLLTQQSLLESLPQNQARVVCLDSDWGAIEQYGGVNLEVGVTSDNLAYVIYTSGSTGQPKGVAIEHHSPVALCHWAKQTFTTSQLSGVLAATSICFDLSVFELFVTLSVGGQVILAQNALDITNLDTVAPITLINTVPSAIAELLRVEGIPPQVQTVNLAGEPIQNQIVQQLYEHQTIEFVYNLYGPSEDTTYSTKAKLVKGATEAPSIGRPIANTQVYLLDSHLQPVPIGVPGELYIGGDGLARGYLKRRELTSEKFIHNPFCNSNSERLYKTGDLARYLPDGNIEFLGRIDNQVKIRGFRIELGEIESVLSSHSQIQQTVVIATEDIPGHKRLVAYVVSENQSLGTNQLREFLKQKLPDYMVPSVFVTLDILPLTPNGKVDRKSLPKPEGEITRVEEYVAPRTEIEQTLTKIWQELLLKDQVSIHDNFFEIGGDSILSIQVVSRAKNSGIQITPQQLFLHQTIAELASIAKTTVSINAQQGLVTGVAPLTPIQKWFFGQNKQEPHHYNQSVLLEIPNHLDPELIETAIGKLLQHHDALRLRFPDGASEEQQQNHSLDHNVPFSVVDLSSTPQAEQAVTLSKIATDYQSSLNLEDGPIMQVVRFNLGQDRSARLLIIIHHLAVDGVSWRILLSDLATIYQQLTEQQPIKLSAKTTAFIDWAQKLNNYAQSEILLKELDYWLNQPWSKATPLPNDYGHSQPENTVGSAASVSGEFSVEETTALLGSVNQAYNTQINDILLSGLVLSLAQWTGNSTVLIDLEGHGREELFSDVDLSRTVGWFTSVFPVLLQLPSLNQPAEVIKSIKEQLRGIPNRGIGYGLLRYLCQDTTVNQQLQTIPTAEISFNYLGQFDQVQSQTGWKFASESTGFNQSKKQTRDHLLEISGLVVDGKLQINWTYSSNVHNRATVEKLADNYHKALRSIIEHCQLEEAFGYTPSDFPLAQLNQVELDELLARIKTKSIESIYPLSPSQQGMLFETLFASSEGIHIEQLIVNLQAQLDLLVFEKAWQCIVERHSLLRTAFVWEGLDEPLMVVLKGVEVTLEQQDWRGLSPSMQQEKLETYLRADRLRGFQMTRAPLIRLALLQVDENTYQFILTFHHILMDGWSFPLILKEFFAFYEVFSKGEDLSLEPSRPYRDYISWLKQRDLIQAEIFWHDKLQGFTSPTPLGMKAEPVSFYNQEERYGQQKASFLASATAALQSKVRQHGLTLNTLIQGVWALLLSRYSGKEDVVFGATVSGRPPDLVGVESMVGLFINTLPMRFQVSPEASFWSWLKDIQNQSFKQGDYEYCSGGQIQQWSEMPGSLPLYESILVFENYPVDSSVQQSSNHYINLLEARSIGAQTKYALTILVIPGSELEFRIVYDRYRFDNPDIIHILEHFQALLKSIVDLPQQHLATLIARIPVDQIPQVRPLQKPVQKELQQGFDAPRNLREIQLLQIWEDVLGVHPVGIRDNFFEHGGNSLIAVRLMSQIQQQFQINLPLATLFQSPTIEQLAVVLGSDSSTTLWSPLVPIQPNGSLPPFFCVGGAGGNVLYLQYLARYLRGDQPFYALQAQGLDGETKPVESMEEIASQYIKAIQTVQPVGPYFLGGHSFGGKIAFEMATQLQRLGQSVAFLAILDMSAPIPELNPKEDFANWDNARWICSMAAIIEGLFGENLQLSNETLASLTPDQQINYFKQQLEIVGILPPQADIKLVRGLLQVYRTQCLIDYVPHNTSPTSITLFRAQEENSHTLFLAQEGNSEQENSDHLSYDPAWGWNQFSDSEVKIHTVPGSHTSMMTEPHVKVLAEKLQKSLEQAQSNQSENLNAQTTQN